MAMKMKKRNGKSLHMAINGICPLQAAEDAASESTTFTTCKQLDHLQPLAHENSVSLLNIEEF